MPLRKTPAESAEKWARKMSQAGPDYIAGINRVSQAPGAAAAANAEGYIAGVQQAVQTRKWQTNTAAVGLQEWKDSAINKGGARLTQGAAAAVNKVQAAQERIAPMIERAQADIANMPRTTREARIARSQAFLMSMMKQADAGAGRRR